MAQQDKIYIEKENEVYLKVHSENGIYKELHDYFSFFEKNYQFSPAYKNKWWDGKKRLFNLKTRRMYIGLFAELEKFCKEREYILESDYSFAKEEFSVNEAIEFIKTLKLPNDIKPHDYQIKAFIDAVREKRLVLISPTGSGKSLIIYLLVRYYLKKTLIVVPTVGLVRQMFNDFKSYGFDSDKFCHQVYEGEERVTRKPITITTWQSIDKMPDEFFNDFDVVIGDEAHHFKAASLVNIMEKLVNCKYRFSMTGTLDGAEVSEFIIQGLFGKIKNVTTTKELIDRKILSDFEIKCLVLNYSDEVKKQLKAGKYHSEVKLLIENESRNKFIKNLTLSLNNNTLLLYNYVDKHGKILYDLIKSSTDRPVFFIDGSVEGEIRENIRQEIENVNDAIIIASYGTFSTGINIKNLHNVIFCFPSKSRIRNLQSIGRVLRKHKDKDRAVLFDIADDLSWKGKQNTTLIHFTERIKIYIDSKFSYKIYNIKLKDD